MSPDALDAVVVGAGPAGLSAATWLGRYRRRTHVIDSGAYRNLGVELSHGYLGADPLDPAEMRDRARRDMSRYELVSFGYGAVQSVGVASDGAFEVRTPDDYHRALRLVLCTGVRDATPDIEGFGNFFGVDAFHCPSCDGYEARDRRIAVLGWGEEAGAFALNMLDWASEIAVVTHGHDLGAAPRLREELGRRGVKVIEARAVGFQGEPRSLTGLLLDDGQLVACDRLFFTLGIRPNCDLALALGCELTDEGCVVVDAEGRTTVEGVFAAGDVTPGPHLIQVAAAKGATAGIACARSLHGSGGSPVSPTPAPDVEALEPD